MAHSVSRATQKSMASEELAAAGQSSGSKHSPSHAVEFFLSGCACVLETFPVSICLISCGEGKGFAR